MKKREWIFLRKIFYISEINPEITGFIRIFVEISVAPTFFTKFQLSYLESLPFPLLSSIIIRNVNKPCINNKQNTEMIKIESRYWIWTSTAIVANTDACVVFGSRVFFPLIEHNLSRQKRPFYGDNTFRRVLSLFESHGERQKKNKGKKKAENQRPVMTAVLNCKI